VAPKTFTSLPPEVIAPVSIDIIESNLLNIVLSACFTIYSADLPCALLAAFFVFGENSISFSGAELFSI